MKENIKQARKEEEEKITPKQRKIKQLKRG
jgi:hypothetical protein